MPDPDHSAIHKKVVGILVEKAELQGYLSIDDLLEIDLASSEEGDQLPELIELLRNQGIEIYDGGAETYPQTLNDSEDVEEFPDLDYISVDDSVSLYLKEMSRVPLLVVEEEVDLAQRMERVLPCQEGINQG